MPFVLIKGSFHLVNRTAAGKQSGFEPDGDSIHFRPKRPARGGPWKLWTRLSNSQAPLDGGPLSA